ncbi:15-cis-phytoene desaturase [Halobacillus karajensis]|uniref:NAD(P)/FAD-dependent oxidoreductase n=1 Tax=Halobacillus karajensis TaxID=195088 RepID=UPI0008A76CA7|nr:NAD(P)/FAD-dependent oxidoreductase [Halobacillus karajensis]SEI14259.1 15-cis-phytoene desaturase [Halobacillus karajensis]
MEQYDAIVVGGGLAGLSSGVQLTSKGKRVLLLEAESVVGGRTSSYDFDGMKVESGFHRYIGYYSHLPLLLRKVGVKPSDILTWEDKIHVRMDDEKPLVLGLAPVYGMIKTIKGFIGNQSYLTAKDKLSLIPFFMKGIMDFLTKPKQLDSFNIKEYAFKHGVTRDAFHQLIVPLSSGIYFLPPDRYSAYVFFGLFAPGIPKFYKMRVGAFLGGMTEVMCDPMAEWIGKNGGKIMVNSTVESLIYEDSQIKGVRLSNGESFYSNHTILATTLHSSKQLLEAHFCNEKWYKPMARLPLMPAVCLQIELSKPAFPVDITTFAPFTCMASFAEQSRTTFQQSNGRLSIILTPPEKFLGMEPKETLELVLKDAKKIGLDLEDKIIDYRQINHVYDFHSLEPGHQQLRPTQNTPVNGLILAGDYTKQPYFSNMEGAAYSGIKAARLVK